MSNISEMNAACGPYMAPWNSSPTVTAAVITVNDSESTRPKNAKAHRAMPTDPMSVTGRRPIRSESAPQAGMVTKCTAEPIRTAFRAVLLGRSRCLVT
ncbi:hypothetical protein SMD44_07548 [Streptomyces alboflavus]|uniref:Uncharacterized protein n=1 Tax=Streptomyces alboflavus TaxID=67267 RepID=A0A1Z1WNN8_9ACTN|nr:hypothetical protein SMD44_07548 [Streptomyces alboflavus]